MRSSDNKKLEIQNKTKNSYTFGLTLPIFIRNGNKIKSES